MNAEERFLSRFRAEFETGSLGNIKFFVKAGRMSVGDLFDQAILFEDTAHEGDVRVIESLDRDFPKTRFDAAFT